MTVVTQESFVIYTGNGATTLFPFGFMIQTDADVVTLWSQATGSVQLDPGSYIITGLDNPLGGSVTYPIPSVFPDPPLPSLNSSQTITIQRVLAPVQQTDISGQANFYTEVIEDGLDYLTYLYQQMLFTSARTVTTPVGSPGDPEDFLNDLTLALNSKANIASPTFTGDPQAPTPATADNDTSIATTAFVKAQGYVTGTTAPVTSVAGKTGAVTLVKADVGLGNVDNTSDVNKPVSTAQQTALNLKLDITSYTAADVLVKIKTVDGVGSGLDADLLDGQDSSYYLAWGNFTGKPATFPPTLPILESDVTNLVSDLALKATLASPIFTGDPRAPTATPGDNDTSIATTAFVTAAVVASGGASPSGSNPIMDSVAAPGVSALYSRGDHVHPSDTSRVAKAGDTMTGNLTINPAAGGAAFNLTPAAAAQSAVINFNQTASTKWQIGKDAADSFYLYDAVATTFPITIASNGTTVTFSRAITMTGNLTLNPPSVGANIILNPATAAQQDLIQFQQSGTAKWLLGKRANDDFYLNDFAGSADVFNIPSNGTTITFGKVVASKGVTDGSSANTGQVGELLAATNSGISIPSNTPATIATLALTAGDWDVWGVASLAFSVGGSNATASIATTTSSFTGSPGVSALTLTSAAIASMNPSLTPLRLSLAAGASVFAVCQGSYSSGTLTCSATLFARRRR